MCFAITRPVKRNGNVIRMLQVLKQSREKVRQNYKAALKKHFSILLGNFLSKSSMPQLAHKITCNDS